VKVITKTGSSECSEKLKFTSCGIVRSFSGANLPRAITKVVSFF